MGNCCVVEGAVDHWVYIQTGDRKGSGTDANVRLIAYDEKGNQSPVMHLDCLFRGDYERGKTDVFQAPPLGSGFGEVVRIELWRENAQEADWFCQVVVVNDRRTEKCFYFPVLRWMQPDKRYKIQANDVLLPQLDANREERDKELQEKRQLYQFGQKAAEMPVQVLNLPEEEQFSDESKADILASKGQLLEKAGYHRPQARAWDGLNDLTSIYGMQPFLEPAGLDRWSSDVYFGAQRLIGCNPTMIRLGTELPENMGITAEMLRPFLEGWTLKQIIKAKRLFVVDLKILDGLPTKDDWPICAPIALFFVTGDKQLVPIAVQLYQDTAPNNPVFLPNDPPFTWLLAKMWFNNADASIHMALSHFAFTHMLMEGVAMAMKRHLSSSHPIYKLLAPHLLHIMSINRKTVDQLFAPDGWVDQCMSIGREGVFELIRRGVEEWRLDVHGNLPKELETRGILDVRLLPNYAYRDDALLIHKAIENYVLKVVKHYYDTPGKLLGDNEIQNWVAELVLEKEKGGIGLNGVPGRGRLTKMEDLVMICINIITTVTINHTATSLPQYDEYAFPPNYPLFLNGDPPTDKVPKGEEDVVEVLPDQAVTLNTMAVTKLFSSNASKSLGDPEMKFQYDPSALQAEKEFQEELEQVTKIVKSRNENRDPVYLYPYLDPKAVANRIEL